MDTWRDIRHKAREARQLLGPRYSDAPAQEALDVVLQRRDITVDAIAPQHPLLRGARAAWREEYGLILVDRTLSTPERLFAIAHELGHHACHAGGDSCAEADINDAALSATLPAGEGRVWGYNPRQIREVEANIFAAELLAPGAELRARFIEGWTYQTLADHYGVTLTCVLNSLLSSVLGGIEPSPSDQDMQEDADVGPGSAGPLSLDDSQRRAAEIDAPRVLVDAGPGTGKTRTLVARVQHLLSAREIAARDILVLTFSNRATDELRERLRQCGPQADGVMVSTFHGFALDMLRRFAPQAGLPDGFRVVDDVDAAILLEEALPEIDLQRYTHLARPTLYLPALLDAAGRMRDLLLSPRDIAEQIDAYMRDGTPDDEERAGLQETLRLLAAYEEMLQRRGLVDYGGLISRAVGLLQSDPRVAAEVRGGLRHVLVDEYQDVNRASAILLRELAADGTYLWVVGDVRQSIYRFRGAEPRNVVEFERDFPDGVRLSLGVNYRATPSLVGMIAAAAERLTDAPASWQADRVAGADEGVTIAVAPDGAAEMAGIAADITRSIAAGRNPEDHAVLCRTHRQAAETAAALERAGLATSYLGALWLRPEIKDLLALLELCRGPDGAALLRLATWPEYGLATADVTTLIARAREQGVPFPAALRDPHVRAGLPAHTQAALARLAAHVEAVRYYPDPAAVLLHYLFGQAPYLRRLLRDDSPRARLAAAAIFQLIVQARGFMARPPARPDEDMTLAFLRYVRRLLANGNTGLSRAIAGIPGAVNVVTIHASKGLEFPIVYIPNLARGRFPPRARGGVTIALPPALQRAPDGDHAEERNLFFVAVSRACDRLVLSRAERYGARSTGASPLLETLHGIDGVREMAWPAAGSKQAHTVDASATPARAASTAGDVATVSRCPSLHHYRRLGLRGDEGAPDYRLFARLLRAGVMRLRAARGTTSWPRSWSRAAAEFVALWDEQWPPDAPLGSWYQAAALQTLQRLYDDLMGPSAQAARYDQEYTIEIDGHTVLVPIDAIEEVDGLARLVYEPATRRSDDATSQTVALYGAAAERMTEAGEAGAQVVIRYLDSGETHIVSDAQRVLSKHRPRLREALERIARDDYPSTPRDDEECLRCPLVFVCPR